MKEVTKRTNKEEIKWLNACNEPTGTGGSENRVARYAGTPRRTWESGKDEMPPEDPVGRPTRVGQQE